MHCNRIVDKPVITIIFNMNARRNSLHYNPLEMTQIDKKHVPIISSSDQVEMMGTMFDEVLNYTKDEIEEIWKYYGVNRLSISQDVEILRVWITQQKHLPQNQDDDFLERFLLHNKFRLEKTKTKVESYYTMRGLYRDVFLQKYNDDFIPSKQASMLLPLPLLTDNQERICVMTLKDPHNFDHSQHQKFSLLMGEILTRNDYSRGEKFIIDYSNVTMDVMVTLPIMDTIKLMQLFREAYSGRILSLDIINANEIINSVVLTVSKLILPKTLHSRLKVHENYDTLYETCPKKCLPRDYGGDLESVDEMKARWDTVFHKYRRHFNEYYDDVANEELRIGNVSENDQFGVDGNFKKLNLD